MKQARQCRRRKQGWGKLNKQKSPRELQEELERQGESRHQRMGKQGKAVGRAKAKVQKKLEKQRMAEKQGRKKGGTRVLVLMMEVMGVPIWKSSGASY